MWKRSDCGIGFFCLITRKQLKIKGPNKYNAIGMACFIYIYIYPTSMQKLKVLVPSAWEISL